MATAGTTMADFLSRTLELGYIKGTSILVVAFGVTFLVWRHGPAPLAEDSLLPHVDIAHERDPARPGGLPTRGPRRAPGQRLPPTDGRYWAAIMVASTLGTTAGDALTNGTELGFGGGALLLGGILMLVLFVESHAKAPNEARYWTALILCSTIGATAGDFITHEEGLDWGYYWGSLFVIGLFLVIAAAGGIRRTLRAAGAHIATMEHDLTTLTATMQRVAQQLEQQQRRAPAPAPTFAPPPADPRFDGAKRPPPNVHTGQHRAVGPQAPVRRSPVTRIAHRGRRSRRSGRGRTRRPHHRRRLPRPRGPRIPTAAARRPAYRRRSLQASGGVVARARSGAGGPGGRTTGPTGPLRDSGRPGSGTNLLRSGGRVRSYFLFGSFTMRAVTMPNRPLSLSAWLRMWQCQAHTPMSLARRHDQHAVALAGGDVDRVGRSTAGSSGKPSLATTSCGTWCRCIGCACRPSL